MNSSLQVNMTNTTDPQLSYAVAYGCIMVLGLPLNAVSLWILLRRHSLQSPNAVFMVNLAISDLMLVISLPMRIYSYATGTWPFRNGVCSFVTILFRSNLRSSSIFITFISVDRLLAVAYPLRSRHLRCSASAWKAAAVTWISVLVGSIIESVSLTRNNNNGANCFRPHSGLLVAAVLQSVLIFTLLAVNVLCTAVVSWTLHRHRPDSAKVNNKVNVMLIFIMNLVMFTICFLPFSISLLQFKQFNQNLPPLICLASINCCLDPLLYYFSLDAFWKTKDDVDLQENNRPTTSCFTHT